MTTLAPAINGSTTNEGTGSIQVLARMGDILTVLEQADDAVTLRDVATRTQLSKPTAHRILDSLVRLNLVERGDLPGTYQLGIRALQLGTTVQRRLNVRTRALPHLDRLTSASEETGFLFLRNGFTALCIERLEGKHVAGQLKLGGSLPLHAGAAARVFLAALEAEELEEYLARDLASLTPKTSVQPADLRRDIAKTRRQGYVISNEDVTEGMWAIGAPIFNVSGEVLAAISISGILPRFNEARAVRLVTMVCSTSRAISTSMGYPADLPLPWGGDRQR